ncbi:hypothetical protein A4X06_0g4494 [Tilletia controversa]|uniref:RRM domain-containing protein n=1 Tax=Tilletia controversa TaxID=13291 RepID=A0A8X7SWG5_9BASI|nr:hypothetical protein CF328_g4022 [Tilletia controversa]KAE8247394.1 hypothetical protein A4X06_0g4494 [Tilletia controversa]
MQAGAPLTPATNGSAAIAASSTNGQQPAATSPVIEQLAGGQQPPASQPPAAGTPPGGPNATAVSATTPTQRRPHLYVGNLSPSVAEHMLIDIFSTAGPVASVKIIPERNQQQQPSSPTRYAFVEFRDISSAEQALQTLNGRKLFDHEIRVNWAHQATNNGGPAGNNGTAPGPHPSIPGSGPKADEAHVFVGDLAPEINDEALRKAFSAFGSLSEARVMWDMVSGKSRGYGFLTFRTKGDAEQAIATMNGEWLGSRAIRVNWANQKNDPAQGGYGGMGSGAMGGHGGARGGPHHHMHGGGGPHGYNAGMGGPHMMGMGMPGAPYGMGGPGGGASMPPGMPLTYEQTLAASHLHNTTIYVGNLLPFTTQNDLVPYFQNYGYITEVRMQADRGFAFVRLDSHENAAMAISQLNGTPIHNRPIKCGWGKDRHEGGRAGAGGVGGAAGGAGAGGAYGGAQGAGMGPQGYGNMMYGMQAQYPYSNAFGGYPGAQGIPGAQGNMGMGMSGAGGMSMPGAAAGLAPPGSATSVAGSGGGQDGSSMGMPIPVPQQQQQQNGGSNGILGTSPVTTQNVGNGGGVPGSVGSASAGGLDAAMQQQMAAAFGGAGQGGYGGLNGSAQGGQEYYNSYAAQYQALGAGGYGGFGVSGQTGNGTGAQGR